MKRTIALLAACTAVAGCGGGESTSGAPAASGGARPGDQPWTTTSQAGLWRHVETRDGRAGPAELVCYAPSMGSLAATPVSGLRCDAGRPTDTADGYALVQRCSGADGRMQEIRSTVTGDLAAAFNVAAEIPGGGSVVSTWMRMGACPDGMSPGQRRADGFMAAPPAPLPQEPRRQPTPSATSPAAPADPIGDVIAGADSAAGSPPPSDSQTDVPVSGGAEPAPAATDSAKID